MPCTQKVLFFLTTPKEKKKKLQMFRNSQFRKNSSMWKQTCLHEPLLHTSTESVLRADSSIWAKCKSVLNKSAHSILTELYWDVFLPRVHFWWNLFSEMTNARVGAQMLKPSQNVWLYIKSSFSSVHSWCYNGKHAEIGKRDPGDVLSLCGIHQK